MPAVYGIHGEFHSMLPTVPIICYLDFDGVLHNEDVRRAPRRTAVMRAQGHTLFEWTEHLSKALEKYAGVRIVLSTAWVQVLGFDRAKACLPSELQQRVVGATFHRRELGPTRELRDIWARSSRGAQIAHDLQRRRPLRWFAIDDAVTEFLPWQVEHLVACRGVVGLSDPKTRQALSDMLEMLHQSQP